MRKIFIDCGAHNGSSVRKFSEAFDGFEIYSFEANPKLAECHRDLPNNLIQAAVWTEDGEIDFFLDEEDYDGSSVFPKKKNIVGGKRLTVPCIDLGKWIKNNFSKDDFIILKMDVEGAEYPILRKFLKDGVLAYINELFVEFHWDRLGIPEVGHTALVRDLEREGLKVRDWDAIVQRNNEIEFLKLKYKFEGQSLRIAFVANGPNQYNAPNISLIRILPRLPALGINPRVVFMMTGAGECSVVEELQESGIRCTFVPWTSTAESVVHLLQDLKANPPDLVCANLSVPAHYAVPWIEGAGIPVVSFQRSDDRFHEDLRTCFIGGDPRFRVSAAVCVSRFLESKVRALRCPEFPVLCCPSGAPVPDSHAISPENGIVNVVFSGRFVVKQKQIHETTEALIRLCAQDPRIRVWMLGDGRERSKVLERVKTSGFKERFWLPGKLDQKSLLKVLPKAHIFILLSDYEGLSTALVEAMACGLVPVVKQTESGLDEIVSEGENGFIVRDRLIGFQAAVQRLVDDSELWKRMSASARATIIENFSTDVVAKRWSGFFHKLKGGARTEIGIPSASELNLPFFGSEGLGIRIEDHRARPAGSISDHSIASDPFLNPSFEPGNADLFFVRSSILRALKEQLPNFQGIFLDVGCGIMPYRDLITAAPSRVSRYVGMDIETDTYRADVDLRWDGRKIPLGDASVDSAMATEVLEHCPEPRIVLKEIRRVLKPGGFFFFTVPFLWPLHDAPYDFHRYTPFALERLFKEAGFEGVEIAALGGWNASLAQMIGLWLKRAPMEPETRQSMASRLWPLYQQLIESDQIPVDPRAGNTMSTGWSGVARAAVGSRRSTNSGDLLDLPICLIRSHAFNYSETFIEDHVVGLSEKLTVLHGLPLPMLDSGKQAVLPQAAIEAIQAATNDTDRFEIYSESLAAVFRSSGVRVVLAESGLMGVRVYRACRKAGVPLVVHFHGVDAYGKGLLDAIGPDFPGLFNTAVAIVVVSEAMRQQLLALGAPAGKLVLSPYGVETSVARRARPASAGATFLAVGRFVEKKAPDLTLRAFVEVYKRHPEARLIMVGDGPLLRKCMQMAVRYGVASAVEFAGARSREEVSDLMSQARCFVQHSVQAADGDSEGLPLAILEAGAHGLPVVATRHAGIPDAVREEVDGILVDERDVKGMAQAMERVASNLALAGTMGASYRRRIEESFDRGTSLRRLQRILKLAAQRAVPPPGTVVASNLWQAGPGQADAAVFCRRIIGLDRNFLPPYVDLARLMIEAKGYQEAYIALSEASRMGAKLPDSQRMLLQNLHDGLQPSEELAEYARRMGAVPLRRRDDSLRILVVTNLFPPQEHGGYGRTMWEFCQGLRSRGHALRILTADCPELERSLDEDLESLESLVERKLSLSGTWEGGVAVADEDPARIAGVSRRNTSLVLREVAGFQPDVCLLGNIDFLGWHVMHALLEKGVPVVHRLGNELPGYPPEATPDDPRYVMAGNTEWVNTGLQARGYPCPRFEVVYPGSPLETYYRAFLPDREVLRIAYASIVTPYKGVHILVEALCRLSALGVAFRCEIAGDCVDQGFVGKLKAHLRAHGLENAVSFIGYQNRQGLAALYARSNVLVFPSVFEEPFGKTQIEAMAAGLLVISSGTGGTREIVRDEENGILFISGDAGDLARKLQSVSADPERWERLAAQGQADAFCFTTSGSVTKLEALFDSLLNQKKEGVYGSAR